MLAQGGPAPGEIVDNSDDIVTQRPFQLEATGDWLVANYNHPCAFLSWAIVNGGWQQTNQVAWLFLSPNELLGVDDPTHWFRARMQQRGLAGAVGLMTSRRLHAWVEADASDEDCSAWAVATVGFSNALRAGDPSGPAAAAGTINLLVHLSTPISTEAALEILSLLSEAKALAALESDIPSRRSGLAASGTGTDYLVLSWPLVGDREVYGGKHTPLGAAAGRAAYDAISQGIRVWIEEQHT